MDIIDVVRKLIGPIDPVGETNTDNKRFENLKTLTDLVDKLVSDIDRVASDRNMPEYSIKRAGEFADEFMDKLGIVNCE